MKILENALGRREQQHQGMIYLRESIVFPTAPNASK